MNNWTCRQSDISAQQIQKERVTHPRCRMPRTDHYAIFLEDQDQKQRCPGLLSIALWHLGRSVWILRNKMPQVEMWERGNVSDSFHNFVSTLRTKYASKVRRFWQCPKQRCQSTINRWLGIGLYRWDKPRSILERWPTWDYSGILQNSVIKSGSY